MSEAVLFMPFYKYLYFTALAVLDVAANASDYIQSSAAFRKHVGCGTADVQIFKAFSRNGNFNSITG